MQRGVVGAANLNQALQSALNPGTDGLRRGGYLFRARDKVMQIRNNYDKEVFNGDIGVVDTVDLEERSLTVNFDGRMVEYDVSELDELVLAYATTIHKSQGSEYPIVVMPVLMNHFIMLQRNLIYTGITRAKKILVIVGTKKALFYAVRNVTVTNRNTMLRERLRKALPQMPGAGADISGRADRVAEEQIPSGSEAASEKQFPFRSEAASEKQVPSGSEAASEKQIPSGSEAPADARMSHASWLKIDLFTRLSRSDFRMRFRLKDADMQYILEKGTDTIRRHAADFVRKRLAPAEPANDGKQTPMRGAPAGHPIFLGQHATGTCCRGCLEKWHGIPKGRALTEEEQEYIVNVLMEWIRRQMGNPS